MSIPKRGASLRTRAEEHGRAGDSARSRYFELCSDRPYPAARSLASMLAWLTRHPDLSTHP